MTEAMPNKRKWADSPMWFALLLGGLLWFAIHCFERERSIRQQTQALTRLSGRELVEHGPGETRYVILTDVALAGEKSVSQRDSDTGALEMYHPLQALTEKGEPASSEVRLLLCIMDENARRAIRDDGNRRRENGLSGLSAFSCAVRRPGADLPGWARKGFAEQHQNIRVDDCWVVTVGLDEPTESYARAKRLQAMAALALGAVVLLFLILWRHRRIKQDAPARSHIQPPLQGDSRT